MKKNHWMTRLAGLMLASYTLLTLTVMAAGSAGTQADPLVTMSYLNNTFMNQLLTKVDEKLAWRDAELMQRLNTKVESDMNTLSNLYGSSGTATGTSRKADTFTVVTLSKGQTLYGEVGCEVMLRVGTATCVSASTPGLIDETDASIISGGAVLVKNHLYMMTISDRGVRATAATTKVLVRGGYSIR